MCPNYTAQTDDSKGAIHYYGNREAINVLGAEAGSRFKSASGKLIRRSIVEKIPFPEGRKVGEDTTCVYQWLYISNLIAVIDQPLYYYYRSNPNSATSDKNKYLPGVYETFDEMMEFFNTEGFPELVDKWSSKYSWAMASKCAFERSENYTTYSLLKKKLQHFIQEKNMSIRDYPYQYEVAYPFRSKVYWLMEGVKHKFKLQPKNQ